MPTRAGGGGGGQRFFLIAPSSELSGTTSTRLIVVELWYLSQGGGGVFIDENVSIKKKGAIAFGCKTQDLIMPGFTLIFKSLLR